MGLKMSDKNLSVDTTLTNTQTVVNQPSGYIFCNHSAKLTVF